MSGHDESSVIAITVSETTNKIIATMPIICCRFWSFVFHFVCNFVNSVFNLNWFYENMLISCRYVKLSIGCCFVFVWSSHLRTIDVKTHLKNDWRKNAPNTKCENDLISVRSSKHQRKSTRSKKFCQKWKRTFTKFTWSFSSKQNFNRQWICIKMLTN